MEGTEISEDRDEFVRRVSRGMCAGSEPAFRLFYDVYFPRLYRHLLLQTRGDEALTRDLLQNVLLRVVKHGREFESEARLWAWLKLVAHSCYVDWVRRSARAAPPLECFEGCQPDEDTGLQEALEQGLESLSSSERELIERCYLRSQAHREIAQELKTTPKAVESKLARIRQKLRREVLKLLNDYAIF